MGFSLQCSGRDIKITAQLAQLDQGVACCIVHVFYYSDITQVDLTWAHITVPVRCVSQVMAVE